MTGKSLSGGLVVAFALVLGGCQKLTYLKIRYPFVHRMLGPESMNQALPEIRQNLLWPLESADNVREYRVSWGISFEPEPWIWVTSSDERAEVYAEGDLASPSGRVT